MPAESPEPTAEGAPLEARANGGHSNNAAGSLGLRLVTLDADRQIGEMEGVLGAAGNHAAQMDALATLRRWQFDPRLDTDSRQRARTLIWRFQSNGWDEA